MDEKELIEEIARSVFEGDNKVNWFHVPDAVKVKYRLFAGDAFGYISKHYDLVPKKKHSMFDGMSENSFESMSEQD